MEVNNNQSGKDTTFNRAALFVASLQEDMDNLSMLNLDFTGEYNGKPNFEICAEILSNHMAKLFGFLTEEERELANRWRNIMFEHLKHKPIFEEQVSIGIGGNKKTKTKNKKHLEEQKDIQFRFTTYLNTLIEKHGLGTPGTKDVKKASGTF
jgi:hypothetical protein